MESSISGLLAEFKIRPMNEYILKCFKLKPSTWLRYWDDICRVGTMAIKHYFLFFQRSMNWIIISNSLLKPR